MNASAAVYVLRLLAVGLFPVSAGLMLWSKDPAWLGLLLATPALASLGWKEASGLVGVTVASALMGFVALVFSDSNASWLAGIYTLAATGALVWVCHRFMVRENLTVHTERQVIEDLEDEIVLLKQEIETCEKGHVQNQNRQRKYSMLNEAAYRLGTSLMLKELAEITLGQIINLLGDKPASFTLFLFNRDGAEILRLQHDTGANLPYPAAQAADTDDINRWVMQRASPLIIRSLERDFRFKGLDLHDVGGRCFLVSPLVLDGRVTGLVRVESRQEDIFDTEDQRLLESFTGMALLALENAKLFRETEELAITDGLTKLLLRRTLMERMAEELARSGRDGQPVAFLLLDIDHFKRINDQHGHPAGDQVLKVVAQIMRGNVRDVDLCGRYGGEEFAVLLPATSQAGAVIVAERIREAVAAHGFILAGQPTRITVSLGVACFPADAHDVENLIERADQALYHSKQSGRDRVSVYPEIPKEAGQ